MFQSVHRESIESERSLSLVERAFKRRKVECNTERMYMDLRFIVPTSNMCKRFFSKAGFALNTLRRRILPVNFEKQMFLHANASLWGIEEVNTVLNE